MKAWSVDGAPNKPDGPNGADGEVMLDIEVAGRQHARGDHQRLLRAE